MKNNKRKWLWILSTIASGIISLVLVDFGIVIAKEEKYLGIITSLIGLVLLYFSYYAPQISSHEDKIKTIEEWIENKEEILNTLKDIVILKKISKIR